MYLLVLMVYPLDPQGTFQESIIVLAVFRDLAIDYPIDFQYDYH
ncbi:hypothetical protein [Muricauda sp. MAR_2010_75]|nr:hypothetical protein [Muricauda sp. MAR_2010_75]